MFVVLPSSPTNSIKGKVGQGVHELWFDIQKQKAKKNNQTNNQLEIVILYIDTVDCRGLKVTFLGLIK